MAKLDEVFGITRRIPTYTYVDRSNLDSKFKYLLKADQHVVIYGESKQGKTVLRKKHLPEDQTLLVQCGLESSLSDLFREIHQGLGTSQQSNSEVSHGSKEVAKLGFEGKLPGIPVKITNALGSEITDQLKKVESFFQVDSTSVQLLVKAIKTSGKRLVLEDFHYLPEEEKQSLAYILKQLYDEGVFVILIGVWSDQNLLTYYCGDLRGRVTEIDVRWSEDELSSVVIFGEGVLLVFFEASIKEMLLNDARGNVGLLQRLAHNFCYESGILETQLKSRSLGDQRVFQKCRMAICDDQRARFKRFVDDMGNGIKIGDFGIDGKTLLGIIQVCFSALDSELINGLHVGQIVSRAQQFDGDVSEEQIKFALLHLNSVQNKRKVLPLVFFYNSLAESVHLVDREFLFFRKYGNPRWPWSV